MSKAPQEDDKAVLAALDGIVRMQRTIRGGLDVCVDTGLVFVRTYYNNLPENVARRLTEINPVAVAAIPGATSFQGTEKARKNIASCVASDAAFAQAIRAANIYRERLGYDLLGSNGLPIPRSRKGAGEVLTIVVQADAPPGYAIGVKEDIAMRLEALGDVRAVSVSEETPEQLHVEGYGGPQSAPRQ